MGLLNKKLIEKIGGDRGFNSGGMFGASIFWKIVPALIIVAIIFICGLVFYEPVTKAIEKFLPVKNLEKANVQKTGDGSVSKIVPSAKKESVVSKSPSAKTTKAVSLQKVGLDDPDLNGLESVLFQIRQASLDNNLFLLEKYYSEPTRAYYVSFGGGRTVRQLKDMIFTNIRKINSGKLLIYVTSVEMSDHTETKDTIFVREQNGWKMGIVETEKYFGRSLIKMPPVPKKN